jgi:hypothetical protein
MAARRGRRGFRAAGAGSCWRGLSRLQSFVDLQASEFAATQVVPTAGHPGAAGERTGERTSGWVPAAWGRAKLGARQRLVPKGGP